MKRLRKGENKMARFIVCEPEEFSDMDVNFVLEDYDGELIEAMNKLRKSLGYTDLVGTYENDVYYNFYVDYNPQTDKIKICGVVNNSEHDDWESYELTISKGAKKEIENLV